MTHRARFTLLLVCAVLMNMGCGSVQSPEVSTAADQGMLVGAWRSKITFQNGPLAGMKDLEFLYSYNAGGTMTESSNYDEAANSSPPAYGVWKQVDRRTFETKYVFYTTKEPGPGDGAPSSRDWWPAGHGVLTERITLSDDGQTYASQIRLSTYDRTGSPIAGDGEGTGAGTRIGF
ncbi:MAG: hypothetical protein ABL986_17945 [Vicinamibacterales bacterium]